MPARPFHSPRSWGFFLLLSLACQLVLSSSALAQALAAPTNIQVTVSRSGTTYGDDFHVKWTDNSTAEDFFAIWVSSTTNPQGLSLTPLAYASPNATSVTFALGTQGFPAGTTLYFWVQATQGTTTSPVYGGFNSTSTVLPSVSLNAPSALAVTFPSTNITRLTWTDNSTSESITEVYARDLSVVGSTFKLVGISDWYLNPASPLDLSHILEANKSYEIKLKVVNFSNTPSGESNVVTVTVPANYAAPPAAPSNVIARTTVKNATTVSIHIGWTDNSTQEGGFALFYGRPNEPWQYLGSVSANNIEAGFDAGNAFAAVGANVKFLVATLYPGVANPTSAPQSAAATFAETASQTAWPNAAAMTIGAPTGLSASFPSTNVTRLTWTDNANSEQYVEVSARDTAVSGSNFQAIVLGTWHEQPLDLFYYFQPGRTYQVRLRVVNFAGTYSGYSDFITLTAPGTYDATPPAAPTNLSVAAFLNASSGNAKTLGVYFDDNSVNETGFEFQDKANGAADSTFASLGILPVSSEVTLGTIRGLGTTLAYGSTVTGRDMRVRAIRGNGPFAIASAFTTTSGATFDTFGPPTDLRAIAPANDGRVQLFWSDNATTETGYEIQYREGTSGSFESTFLSNTSFSRYQNGGGIGGFSPGATVQFQIRAVQGTSAQTGYSNLSTVTIPSTLAAPTELTATVLGENSVKLDWTDNTTNEAGFLIQARFLPNGTFFDTDVLTNSTQADYNATARTRTLALPNTLPYPGASYEFRVVAAFAPAVGSQITSAPSNAVTAAVPFNAPTGFTATVVGENTVNFTWVDNSAVESGFYLLVKESGAQQYSLLATAAANATSRSVTVLPGLTYDFAVVAAYFNSVLNEETESALSNVVTRSLPFNSPSGLTAMPSSDRQINLIWTDQSAAESGFIIYCKTGSSAFQPCGVVGPNVTSFSTKFVDADGNSPLLPDTTYQFELRAFAGDFKTFTAAITGSATTKDGVTADLSPPMVVNQAFSHTFAATQGQSTISSSSITGTLPPGVSYNSATRTLSGTPTARGSFTPILTVNWANGWSSNQTLHLRPYFQPGRPVVTTPIADHTLAVGDSPLSIPLSATFSDPDTESAVAISLPGPDGTPGTRSITIILNDSVTPITVTNFKDYITNATSGYTGSVFERLVPGFVLQGGTFKSSSLPGVASNAFERIRENPSMIQNEPGMPNIAGTLAMAKQSGNPNSATSAFFFNLADNTANLDYQNEGFSVFGRVAQPSLATLASLASLPLPPGVASGQPANYQVIAQGNTTKPFVVSSTTTSGSTTVVPSSFVTSFLVGYAVHGAGIPANTFVTAVNGTTNITLSNAATSSGTASLTFGEPATFSSMPYNAATAPAPPIDASKLVRINSVTSSVPVLSGHSANSSSTGVATASVSGTDLTLSPVAPGTSTISLQVTDLDGNQLQVPLTFQVTVNNTLSNWATTEGLTSGQNGPTDDPDLDGRKNLLEYALMSSPGTANGSADPALNTVTEGADKKATITFKVRKFAALTYTVEAGSSFNSWTPIWTSTSGFAVPAVSAAVNNADHTLVTIKDSVPYSDTTPRFLRLTVTSP